MLVLKGHPHEPIVAVLPGSGGMRPPGLEELVMVERPVAVTGGCLRHRWSVSFQRGDSEPIAAARLSGAFSTTDVALAATRGCPADGYVGVSPGLGAAAALPALALLHSGQAGRGTPTYQCIDLTHSDVCASPDRTRQEIARLRPWMISHDLDHIVFWLGTPGGTVTDLRYIPGDHVSAVTVERRVPAPF